MNSKLIQNTYFTHILQKYIVSLKGIAKRFNQNMCLVVKNDYVSFKNCNIFTKCKSLSECTLVLVDIVLTQFTFYFVTK